MDGTAYGGTGDEVVILPALNWGDRREAPGPAFAFLGDATDGTHAELVSVPTANLFPKPTAGPGQRRPRCQPPASPPTGHCSHVPGRSRERRSS